MTFTHPDNAPEGHKWQTREGKPVRIICTDAKNPFSIVALVTNEGSNEIPKQYQADGRFFENTVSQQDIIDAPKPKRVIEGWVNVYRDPDGQYWCNNIYSLKSEADAARDHSRLSCIHIRAEEGEGL